MSLSENRPELQGAFRTTHWSVVLKAGTDSDAGKNALESLCRAYWYPLYAYVRRRGKPPQEAEDLTQEFFAHLLERNRIAKAQPDRGRFRTFLLTSMKNFLLNEWDRANRMKRGGGREILSLDALDPEARYAVEPSTSAPDEVVFDRQWARSLMKHVMKRMRDEAEQDETANRFDELKRYLAADPGDGGYQSASDRLSLSPAAVKSAIYRLRRRYGQLLREEIANTVSAGNDIEDEIRHLFAVLGA